MFTGASPGYIGAALYTVGAAPDSIRAPIDSNGAPPDSIGALPDAWLQPLLPYSTTVLPPSIYGSLAIDFYDMVYMIISLMYLVKGAFRRPLKCLARLTDL